jgi:hypothetical protein
METLITVLIVLAGLVLFQVAAFFLGTDSREDVRYKDSHLYIGPGHRQVWF